MEFKANWNHLYCFYEVAKTSSLQVGACNLGISSATASEKIKRLEASLKQKLFDRSQKKMNLTKEGVFMFENCKEIFEMGKRLIDASIKKKVVGYSVRVGIQDSVLGKISINFLSHYWDIFKPYGSVNTQAFKSAETLFQNLINYQLDWVITVSPALEKESSLNCLEIGAFKVILCGSQKLLREQNISSQDLIYNYPLVRLNDDYAVNNSINSLFNGLNIPLKGIIETDHFDLMVNLIFRGRALGFLPQVYVKENIIVYDIAPLSDIPAFKVPLYLTYRLRDDNMVAVKEAHNLAISFLKRLPF